MTNISIGTTRTNIRIADPVNNQPVNKPQEVKLRGINWSDKVSRNDTPQPVQDKSDITVRDNGSIPSSNDLPDIFSDNNQNIPEPNYNDQQVPQAPQKSSGGGEMATGIGMAIGGVSGALIGKKFGFTKLGIAIGVAIGGFAGNKIGK